MDLLSIFFKKKKPIITEEDEILLRDIQRRAYMEEAKKLMEERGHDKAKQDLGLKPKKENYF